MNSEQQVLPETNESYKAASTSYLVVVGMNYHSCPIYVREKFVIPDSCLSHALFALSKMPHLHEAAILSTCNRTEVYAVVSDIQAGLQEIESFFLSTQQLSEHNVIKPNFKLLHEDVALHLFRVTAGLDSLILGEGQIISQVKHAFKKAQEHNTVGTVLSQLFQTALTCGKRVRTDTSMGKKAVSVSSAAVELVKEKLGTLSQKTGLIIGAGKMAQICAKHILSHSQPPQLIMVNRTTERLEYFASNNLPNKNFLEIGFRFDDRHQLIGACDFVIVSTNAPNYIVSKEKLEWFLQKDTLIIDISVPRNVDPSISSLDKIQLYHADDLANIVNRNKLERESLVSEAEVIVQESLESYQSWERSLLVAPTITEFRRKIEAIRKEQLTKHENNNEEFSKLSKALINQILHHPTTQLKSTSDYQLLKQQAEALRSLFQLDIFESEQTSYSCTFRSQ